MRSKNKKGIINSFNSFIKYFVHSTSFLKILLLLIFLSDCLYCKRESPNLSSVLLSAISTIFLYLSGILNNSLTLNDLGLVEKFKYDEDFKNELIQSFDRDISLLEIPLFL